MVTLYNCIMKCDVMLMNRPGLPEKAQRRRRVFFALCVILLLSATVLVIAAVTPRFTSTPETKVWTYGAVTMDLSNASEGYIAVKHAKTDKGLKLRIMTGSHMDTYDLSGDGEYNIFPLQYGAATYNVTTYTGVGGNRYANECTHGFYADIKDPDSCFLYPNQRAWYTEDSAVVAKAAELCAGLETDLEKIQACYNYIRENVKYDYILAMTVETGYLPDPDSTLASGKGICYDMASLLTAMLRSQGIYTKTVTGNLNSNVYHAWNKVLVDGKWRMLDPTNGSRYKASAYEELSTF